MPLHARTQTLQRLGSMVIYLASTRIPFGSHMHTIATLNDFAPSRTIMPQRRPATMRCHLLTLHICRLEGPAGLSPILRVRLMPIQLRAAAGTAMSRLLLVLA